MTEFLFLGNHKFKNKIHLLLHMLFLVSFNTKSAILFYPIITDKAESQ